MPHQHASRLRALSSTSASARARLVEHTLGKATAMVRRLLGHLEREALIARLRDATDPKLTESERCDAIIDAHEILRDPQRVLRLLTEQPLTWADVPWTEEKA